MRLLPLLLVSCHAVIDLGDPLFKEETAGGGAGAAGGVGGSGAGGSGAGGTGGTGGAGGQPAKQILGEQGIVRDVISPDANGRIYWVAALSNSLDGCSYSDGCTPFTLTNELAGPLFLTQGTESGAPEALFVLDGGPSLVKCDGYATTFACAKEQGMLPRVPVCSAARPVASAGSLYLACPNSPFIQRIDELTMTVSTIPAEADGLAIEGDVLWGVDIRPEETAVWACQLPNCTPTPPVLGTIPNADLGLLNSVAQVIAIDARNGELYFAPYTEDGKIRIARVRTDPVEVTTLDPVSDNPESSGPIGSNNFVELILDETRGYWASFGEIGVFDRAAMTQLPSLDPTYDHEYRWGIALWSSTLFFTTHNNGPGGGTVNYKFLD